MTGRTAGVVGLVGVVGWIGLIWLGARLYLTNPPTAGFDLELLLRAGRAVAAGHSPYDPAMLAGAAPVAERLFYSYPPLVAQLMSLVAVVPSPVTLVIWDAAAVAGFAVVARLIATRFVPGVPAAAVAWSAVALVPLMFPLAIGLLFGNLDVFFPLLYGLMLLAITPRLTTMDADRGGVASAVAGLTKLHPGSMGLWFLARAPSTAAVRRVVVVAIAVAVTLLATSLLVGGVQPWLDYLSIVRAGSGADLVDPRNAGPAAQVALLIGGGGPGAEALARTLQIPVTAGAFAITGVAAWRVHDPVESLTWAAVASFVILPVTWYHYPSALIPFALAALVRSRRTPAAGTVQAFVGAAAVVAAAAIAWLPLLYIAIGLVLAAARLSGRSQAGCSPRGLTP
jgi:hypothetical protein